MLKCEKTQVLVIQPTFHWQPTKCTSFAHNLYFIDKSIIYCFPGGKIQKIEFLFPGSPKTTTKFSHAQKGLWSIA